MRYRSGFTYSFQFPAPGFFIFHIPTHLDQLLYGCFGLDDEITFFFPQIITNLFPVWKVSQQLKIYGILEENTIVITARNQD